MNIEGTDNISKRSLTFNKSFIISILVHLILVFGVSLTAIYKLPVYKKSPIINVRFANSDQDTFTHKSFASSLSVKSDAYIEGSINSSNQEVSGETLHVKRLEANSRVNSEEAVYLNLWQRNIETYGNKIISKNKKDFIGTVQIKATIDSYGNLIDSKILISSGDIELDRMALEILKQSSPFAPFNKSMIEEYSVLEIVRNWDFSSKL